MRVLHPSTLQIFIENVHVSFWLLCHGERNRRLLYRNRWFGRLC